MPKYVPPPTSEPKPKKSRRRPKRQANRAPPPEEGPNTLPLAPFHQSNIPIQPIFDDDFEPFEFKADDVEENKMSITDLWGEYHIPKQKRSVMKKGLLKNREV